MHRHLVAALAAAAAALSAPAAQAETHWLCGLSEDALRLVCLAEAGPTAAAEPAPAPAVRAVVHGTAFPLDPRRRWVVELGSPPSETAFVEQLARATICYRSPDCSVSLAPWRSGPVAAR
ncbi:MAG: hypothetical protein KIT35_20430 [Piscinibacter sp.]|uniref:hypothetical protein n=1 Tax=Piscinibacter sp. TaxID=1903157 RepID=UPI002583FD52|nr:hypothetical protein [Piscinibacter sp.]MCW5666205.1 hypothetical protein [Piscinibacter sp.]